MNKLDQIYSGLQSGADYAKAYVSLLSDFLGNLDFAAIDKVITLLLDARKNEKTIFFIGDGGSAATASHFCEDLGLGAYCNGKLPFKALSLTDNMPYITALGNDEGFEHIFTGQLRTMLNAGDVVIGISGSGNSANLVKAMEFANTKDAVTIGLVGFDGGKMSELCQYCIHVKTEKGLYAPVEDMQLILGHIISTYLMFRVREE
ncbi:MAG: SIS domain-containing protein [Pseudomonadota bacterium]